MDTYKVVFLLIITAAALPGRRNMHRKQVALGIIWLEVIDMAFQSTYEKSIEHVQKLLNVLGKTDLEAFAYVNVALMLNPQEPNGERSDTKLTPAKMDNLTQQNMEKVQKTVECSMKTPCSMKDKINSDNFTVEVYNVGNPIAITADKLDISILLAAANINDAAKFFDEAEHLYKKAEREENQLKRAKAMTSWARVRVKAEEMKGIAAKLARSIVMGKQMEEQTVLLDKVLRALFQLWFSDKPKYPHQDALYLFAEINPTRTFDDDIELPSLLEEIYAQVEESCLHQKIEVILTEFLKEGMFSEKRALMEETILAAKEVNKVRAALITNILTILANQKSFDTVKNNIELVRDVINNI